MSWEHLHNLKAQGFSHNPGAYDEPSEWTRITDTDHNEFLQSRRDNEIIAHFDQAHDDGYRMLLHMVAFEDSILTGHTNAHDPDNPAIVPVREHLGRMATPLPGGKFYENGDVIDPPDPPDPPDEDLIDLVSIICPELVTGTQNGEGKSPNWTVHDSQAGFMTHIKNPLGTAADLNWYDEEGVYLWITEDGEWGDPRSFKRHTPGWYIRWPRFFKDEDLPIIAENLNTDYIPTADCVDGPVADVGVGMTVLKGPFKAGGLGIAGNDLPSSEKCYTMEWVWQTGERLERLQLATTFGRVFWKRFDSDGSGGWIPAIRDGELMESPIRNKRLSDPAPEFNFPCFNIPEEIARMKAANEGGDPPPDPPDPPDGGDDGNDLFRIIAALLLLLILTGALTEKE